MSVIHAKGRADIARAIEQGRAENRLTVIDWSAVWCGPCQRIKPEYASLAARYPQALWVEVESEDPANKADGVVAAFNVRAFPTFTFFLEGNEVERFSGASPQKIEDAACRLMVKAEDLQLAAALKISMDASPGEGSKQQAGGDAAPAPAPAPDSEENTSTHPEWLVEATKAEEADPEPTGGASLELKVKRNNGQVLSVSMDAKASAQHLRRKLAIQIEADLSAIRLIFKGRMLVDGNSLDSYGIKESGLTVHVAVSGITKSRSPTTPAAKSPPNAPAADGSGAAPANPAVVVLRNALSNLETRNGKQLAREAAQVMMLYVRNIVTHPEDVKYRSIRQGNPKFSSKVGNLSGGRDCMAALGFEHQDRNGEAYLVLKAGVGAAAMTAFKDELAAFAESNAPTGVANSGAGSSSGGTASPAAQNGQGTNPFASLSGAGNFASMFGQQMGGNLGSGLGAGLGQGGMPQVTPEMMQSMQNNPMMQGMMQRLMSNPSLMNSIMQAVQSGQDPTAAMMSDPNLMQMMMETMQSPEAMQQMMGMRQMMGGAGASGFGSPFSQPFGAFGGTSNNASVTGQDNNGSTQNSTQNSTNNSTRSNNNNAANGQDEDDDLDDLDDIYST